MTPAEYKRGLIRAAGHDAAVSLQTHIPAAWIDTVRSRAADGDQSAVAAFVLALWPYVSKLAGSYPIEDVLYSAVGCVRSTCNRAQLQARIMRGIPKPSGSPVGVDPDTQPDDGTEAMEDAAARILRDVGAVLQTTDADVIARIVLGEDPVPWPVTRERQRQLMWRARRRLRRQIKRFGSLEAAGETCRRHPYLRARL